MILRIDGADAGRCSATAEMAVPFLGLPPIECAPSPTINRGDRMNTAAARRLALGDRIVWIGNDGRQPTGLGTITRITVHEVEVRWDVGTMMRYRRAHLHNLRHVKLNSSEEWLQDEFAGGVPKVDAAPLSRLPLEPMLKRARGTSGSWRRSRPISNLRSTAGQH